MGVNEHPSEADLQAFVDGQAGSTIAIREHCRTCPRCRRVWEEMDAVREILRADVPTETLRPMWPMVRERLGHSSPKRFGLSFTFGTFAAAAVGIVLGVLVGSMKPPEKQVEQRGLWFMLGATTATESGATLPDIYTLTRDEGS